MSGTAEERLVLVPTGEDRAGAELPRQGMLTVGSSKERAVFHLQGEGVEAVHCAIGRAKGGGWAIRDLGSAAGTIVNGRRVEVARLAAGDRIRLGARELTIVAPGVAPGAASGAAAGTTSGAAAAKVADARKPTGVPPSDTQTLAAALPSDATAKPREDVARARASASSDHETAFETRAGATLGREPARDVGREPARDPAREPGRENAPPQPVLSGYRVERLLGRGGMGSVYLAVQTSLDRPVALKVLAPNLAADREFVRRFQAEARAAAALAHPNVVTVYDVGEERGTHYLSMEYMDRGTLEERVAPRNGVTERLPWREALDVLRDAAAGLVYAESKKIVHRDLKPANLMQNHVGATKIADLGLATHMEAEERQSADKKVFGTPHFMSPEQARGEKIDGRSDLYSLGATAYRLLTGHTPFEGTSAREIVRAHLTLEPRPMRELVPDLPEEAVALVTKLMRKDPAERYASAAELLREIERARAQVAAAAAPVQKKKRKSVVPKLLLLIVLGGAGWWLERERPWEKKPPPIVAHTPSVPDATSPPDAAVPPSVPDVTPSETPPAPPKAVDDDKSLQLLEANARVALLELAGKEMTPAEKRDALRELAEKWRGTSAASEAIEKADKIETDMSTLATADVDRQARIDEMIARMESAAGPATDPPRPGPALLAVKAVPGQEAFADDAEFIARKKEIERSIVGRAVAHAKAKVQESESDMQKGDFDGMQQKLSELMPVFELPDFPPGEGPAGVAELYEIGRTARERLKNLELIQGQFVSQKARDDALAIAQAFGGPSGLERELRSLDLAAAKGRLAGVEGKLSTPEAQALVRELQAEVAGGERALSTLGREFGAWRRKGFGMTRGGKNVTRNAVGADATGLLTDGDGGAVERVPWSEFGGDDRELSNLFTERLTREWTPEETRGIAGLLKLTAVVEAIGRASKMFDPSRRMNFTETDVREMTECFAQAQAWAQKAGTSDALTKELAAARQLSVVCQKITDGAWSVAVAATEELLGRHQGSLLVTLLSDGTLTDVPK